MKLTAKAIRLMGTREGRAALMVALGFTEQWIKKCLKANKENGPLTTVLAVQTISEVTGLQQSEILN